MKYLYLNTDIYLIYLSMYLSKLKDTPKIDEFLATHPFLKLLSHRSAVTEDTRERILWVLWIF